MSCVIKILPALLFVFLSIENVNAIDVATYSSLEYRFGFNYPGNWKEKEQKLPGVVVRITSPDDTLGFNVGAEWDSSLRHVHPKSFVNTFLTQKKLLIATYQKEFPNFKLLESGETTLCNQPAYYIVYTHVYRSMGQETPWKTMQVLSNRSGIQYTLTAAGYPQIFDNNIELLTSIFRSFITDVPSE